MSVAQASPGIQSRYDRDDQATLLRALVRSNRPGRVQNDAEPVPVRVPMIAIASGKGGVGKTVTAVNVCAAIYRQGIRVVLIDADFGTANADVLCGISPTRRLDAMTQQRLSRICVRTPAGFGLVPGSVGMKHLAKGDVSQRAMVRHAAQELSAAADLIVIDTGAGIDETVVGLCLEADLTAVVATGDPTSIADAYALIKTITLRSRSRGDQPDLGVVINQTRSSREAHAVHHRLAAVSKRFLKHDLAMLGWISRDGKIAESVRQRSPLLAVRARRGGARDLARLSQTLLGRIGLLDQGGNRVGL